MTDATDSSLETSPGYQLGEPIALCDLLSLPPDGRRYTRDDQGRLAYMSPDSPRNHRVPLSVLVGLLHSALRPSASKRWFVSPEPGVGFEPVYSLRGERIGPSRLGHKKLEPDVAVWQERPVFNEDPRGESCSADGLRLIAEILSPGTWRTDLGQGNADDVDRWRTYLEAGVSEYWLLNPGPEPCGLPSRTGLFLSNQNGTWKPLPGESLEHAANAVNGLLPVRAGTVHSTLPGLTLDLAAYWEEAGALD